MSLEVTGYVYYARIGRHIKIGYAEDVRKRMMSYPPETELLAVEPGSYALEAVRLEQFAESLVWGNEWFDPSTEVKMHIADVRRINGLPDESMKYEYTARNPRASVRRLPQTTRDTSGEWLSVADAAAELGVDAHTIRRWITQGRVEGHRVGPKLIRIRATSLRTMGRPLQYIEA